MTLRIDVETYSSADLPKCGVARYVQAPDFAVLLFAYAYDDEEVKVVDLAQGEQLPLRVRNDLTNPAVLKTAFNAAFEIATIGQHFKLELDPAQWSCTSVAALYLGLPNSLYAVSKVLKLDESDQKQGGGFSLIRYFSMPCKPTKANQERTRNLPHHDPDKWALYKEYCRQDVHAEREVAKMLEGHPLPENEQRLWVLDQKMNARGVGLDLQLVDAAIEADTIYKTRLLNEAVALTGLDNPNSVAQLGEWFSSEYGIEVESFNKKNLPELLEKVDDETAKRVIELRQELSKTSVAKYTAMRNAVCRDGRLRGLLQFYGANRTGRWAGRLVQVQNLRTNSLPDLDLARTMVKKRDFEGVELLFDSVPDTLSQLIRTAFVAKPNHRFIVVDFSAIEARVIAWLAHCQWRLDVFNGDGRIYEASAEKMFKLPEGSLTKKSPYRQRGKVSELALSYGGGAGALKTMGALKMGLTEEELEPIKHAWRDANPEIKQLWWDCEWGAIDAVSRRDKAYVSIANDQLELEFSWEQFILFVKLPSGRRLAYVAPKIVSDDQTGRLNMTYRGINQKTRVWARLDTYGGKLVENIVQAIARDCLCQSMLALDEMNYQQLMTIHDEIVIEAPIGVGSLDEVTEILGAPIAWAPGLPLRADGFETLYYQKEIE